ncbi:MAG: flagellar biosynthetic protein FliR [Desulfobacterales bacterium]|nr:flagellar biosynthetic protein FliR [Desulfobacterales bacterium]
MDLLNFSVEDFKIFILVLSRVSILIFMFPIFRSPMFPDAAKAGLALLLSFLFFPSVKIHIQTIPSNAIEILIMILAESIIGLTLGLVVSIFFGAVQFAGYLVGFQMSFAIANVLDPLSGEQISIIQQMAYLMALILFLLFNGHLLMISAIQDSFGLIQVGFISIKKSLFFQIMTMSGNLFLLGIKISAPPFAACFFVDVAFGIISKFTPQIPILIVGMPIKIGVGLLFFGVSMKVIMIFTKSFVEQFPTTLRILILLMGS